MSRYLLRRILIAIPSLLGISLVLFTILALAPGDPFSEMTSNPNIPREVAEALREKFGLNDPIMVRYWHWLLAMLQGDWIGSSQLLALAIAIPIGVIAASRPYSIFDQLANTLAFIGFSLPTFFTGILFILFFSVYLNWLPFVYQANLTSTGWQLVWDQIKQMIMPVAVLGLFQAGSWTRYVRSAVLDVIRLDYVTTARSKGLPKKIVMTKHVLRNALIPVVTLVALQMPAIFGGAIVTEQIFRIPGIGSLLISSMLANDTPVIMAVTFVFSALVIACNLLADLIYGWLDPRISFS